MHIHLESIPGAVTVRAHVRCSKLRGARSTARGSCRVGVRVGPLGSAAPCGGAVLRFILNKTLLPNTTSCTHLPFEMNTVAKQFNVPWARSVSLPLSISPLPSPHSPHGVARVHPYSIFEIVPSHPTLQPPCHDYASFLASFPLVISTPVSLVGTGPDFWAWPAVLLVSLTILRKT